MRVFPLFPIRIDRQFLTFNDIVAMVSALRGVNTALENRELDTAIEKITSLVPGHQTDQLKKYFEQVVIDILPMGYTRKQKDVFQEVHRAVVQERLLKVIYRNNKGETKQRTIEPMTVIFKGYAWYLFAFCRLRDDYRLFRLSRISKPRVSEEKFERRERSYREIFISDDDKVKMVSLKLKFSPRARTRVEDFFEEKQIEYKKDGTMIVRVTFPEDVWVYATLLSYGEDVEILDPPHIRSLIQEKANKIIEIYQSDSTK